MNNLVIFLLALLSACGPTQQVIKGNSPISGNVIVKGNQVLINMEPYAEIRCLSKKSLIETSTSSVCTEGLGVSIYYLKSGKEKWIYPQGGWAAREGCIYISDRPVQTLTEVKSRWDGRSICGEKTAILMHVFGIEISNDGRKVFFTVPHLLSDITSAYDVESGKINRVRKRWVNRIF